MLRRSRRLLLVPLLLAVSVRVFTGAAEAQVSFTTLVSDSGASDQIALQKPDQSSSPEVHHAERANPIPDKQRNTVTYKKYLTPENSTLVLQKTSQVNFQREELTRYKKVIYSASPVWVLRANAPPKSSFAPTHPSAQKTYSFISWENQIGKSTIYNGTGRISSL